MSLDRNEKTEILSGLALSRAYYEEFGKPMIEEQFGEFKDRIAVGLVGHGSECFGFDDEISRDHDFEPGFCLWIPEEDEEKYGFRLFRAYRNLPKEYRGFCCRQKSLFGSDGKGVKTVREFYRFYTPSGDLPRDNGEWLNIPDTYLAEATNGEIFTDPLGEFTRIRDGLRFGRPEDVRLKKLASAVFKMAQSGQYAYARCLAHGEIAAAGVALSDFAQSTAQAFYLIHRRYAPYYKWLFRGLSGIAGGDAVAGDLEALFQPGSFEGRSERIERLSARMASMLRETGICTCDGDYLEPYAYEINGKIKDGNLRNSSVML